MKRGQSYASYDEAYYLAVLNLMHLKITVDDTKSKLLSTTSLYFLQETILRKLDMGQTFFKVGFQIESTLRLISSERYQIENLT